MKLNTPVPLRESQFPITYESEIFSIGSCFAINMAEKFDFYQFKNTVNPYGILFHPAAIQKYIATVTSAKEIEEDGLVFHNERWHCFDAHSEMSHTDRATLLLNLQNANIKSRLRLRSATHIILTLGTAWVYRHKSSGMLVANCHKLPQQQFDKELLTAAEIDKSITAMIGDIQDVNSKARIIFTVSPVRHLKDGFIENQVSKSNLISGLYSALKAHMHTAAYFPAYEVMMDELRDYRFYAADMVHPNDLAVEYIWQCFAKSNIPDTARTVMDEVEEIRKGLAHRPFNQHSGAHAFFVEKLSSRIKLLQGNYPHMKF